MSKNIILKSYVNEVLLYIKSNGLDATEFSWEETYSTQSHPLLVSKLVHKHTAYYFIFDFLKDAHFCEYSPGKEKLVDKNYPGDWTNQFSYFKYWISYLKREIEAPDLWGALQNERSFINASADTETNELFKEDEKAKIKSSLNKIKEFIYAAHILQLKDREFVEGRFQYLIDSSERLGKKDWINITLGVLINVILFLSLPSESAGELFRFVSVSLQWLLKASIKIIP
ncbi:MAG: hypothetical protein ACYDEE_00580 [Ignavibacteriaceae bacterium]